MPEVFHDVMKFLSTPSARRATPVRRQSHQPGGDFYPRPPRGGRPVAGLSDRSSQNISIHALREEGDLRDERPDRHHPISIHALREEGDVVSLKGYLSHSDFYPRPPRGGRPSRLPKTYTEYIFLSTPSARRATWVSCTSSFFSSISIHALREEGDMPI